MEDHGVDVAEKEVIRPENNAGDRSNHIRLHRPRHKGIVCVSSVHSSTNQSSYISTWRIDREREDSSRSSKLDVMGIFELNA